MINFRTLTIEDICDLLTSGGVITDIEDFAFAVEHGLFKYLGCADGNAKYMYAYIDQEVVTGYENQFCVGRIYVSIEHDKLVAEYSSAPWPELTTDSIDVLQRYFENQCV